MSAKKQSAAPNSKIFVIFRKEMKEIKSSRSLLIVLLATPIILAGIIVQQLLFTPATHLAANASFELAFFGVLYPLVFAGMISFDSFIGERTKRTIEPLLAAPISERDLFVGKVLAAFIPAISISYAIIGVLSSVLFLRLGSAALEAFSFQSLIQLFWLAPVLALTGTCVITIVSARVNDSRTAMGIGNFLVVGLFFGLTVLTTSSFYYSNAWVGPAFNGTLTVASIVLLWVGIRVFSRESLLSRI